MQGVQRARWLLLVLVFALVAAACGDDDDATTTTAAAAGDTTTTTEGEQCPGSIHVLLPDSASSARWESDDRRFFQAAFEGAGLIDGVNFSIVNAEGDPATQITQAEAALAAGASVILLTNLDSGSGAAIIELARASGAKVIDYDRLTIEGEGADVYVSFNNVAVGQTMADVIGPAIDALGGTPNVVMLNGGPTDNNAALFKTGYNVASDFAVSKRVEAGAWALAADQDTPNWDNQEALTIFEQILVDTGGNVDAVFAANDGLANSVIQALKAGGFDPVPLSGQDATVAGMQNILSGWQTMSVYKPIQAEAEAAAAAALALRCGEDPLTSVAFAGEATSIDPETNAIGIDQGVPYIALTPIGVTIDNIAETVIAVGFRTWEEICTGEFIQFCPPEAGGPEETTTTTEATTTTTTEAPEETTTTSEAPPEDVDTVTLLVPGEDVDQDFVVVACTINDDLDLLLDAATEEDPILELLTDVTDDGNTITVSSEGLDLWVGLIDDPVTQDGDAFEASGEIALVDGDGTPEPFTLTGTCPS